MNNQTTVPIYRTADRPPTEEDCPKEGRNARKVLAEINNSGWAFRSPIGVREAPRLYLRWQPIPPPDEPEQPQYKDGTWWAFRTGDNREHVGLVIGDRLTFHPAWEHFSFICNVTMLEQVWPRVEKKDCSAKETFPAPPEGEQWHNPDNLTPSQVGVKDGWRLLLKSEVRKRGSADCEAWRKDRSYWDKGRWGTLSKNTYRTKKIFHWDRPSPETDTEPTPQPEEVWEFRCPDGEVRKGWVQQAAMGVMAEFGNNQDMRWKPLSRLTPIRRLYPAEENKVKASGALYEAEFELRKKLEDEIERLTSQPRFTIEEIQEWLIGRNKGAYTISLARALGDALGGITDPKEGIAAVTKREAEG